HLTRTGRMARRPYQDQLVSEVRARARSTWLPRGLAVESLGPFRRLLEDAQGRHFSGKRSTETGGFPKGTRSPSTAVEPRASTDRGSRCSPRPLSVSVRQFRKLRQK